MADDDGGTAVTRRAWFLLLRRALGIPDIIGPEAATAAIEAKLRDVNGLDEMERPDNPTMETVVIDGILEAGRLHELDESLLGFDGGNLVARAAVNRYVANHTNWTSKGMYAAIEKLTDFAVERLRSHLDLHPLDEGSP